MKKIAFMCDSSADISSDEASLLDLYVVRMPIILNGKEYIEDTSINDQKICEALSENGLLKTAQPRIGDIKKMWDDLLVEFDEVFYIPISKALSGTYEIASALANNYEGRVCVVESKYVCYPIVHQLISARKLFENGYSTEEIKFKIENESELFAILIPETLQTLKNGGRISAGALALANLLKIQPLLKVEEGAIDVVDKVRTLKKAYKVGLDIVCKDIDPQEYEWMIIHAQQPLRAAELKKILEEQVHQPVSLHAFKAVILAHTGVGTIGFGRIKKLMM